MSGFLSPQSSVSSGLWWLGSERSRRSSLQLRKFSKVFTLLVLCNMPGFLQDVAGLVCSLWMTWWTNMSRPLGVPKISQCCIHRPLCRNESIDDTTFWKLNLRQKVGAYRKNEIRQKMTKKAPPGRPPRTTSAASAHFFPSRIPRVPLWTFSPAKLLCVEQLLWSSQTEVDLFAFGAHPAVCHPRSKSVPR